jgi:hypothetical protein
VVCVVTCVCDVLLWMDGDGVVVEAVVCEWVWVCGGRGREVVEGGR